MPEKAGTSRTHSPDGERAGRFSGVWERVTGVLSLFTSTGTLLCCAIPAALGAIAGGAATASLVSAAPWLVPLSRNKEWLFIGAGVLIALQAVLLWHPRQRAARCEACEASTASGDASRFARFMFWASLAIYVIGVFFAYALVPILRFFEN